ncbi:FAD-dependent oxidoreductase [Kocuria atrinae]|uniref:FAD-dependent oxidoreductase n=1 Tax=Kocuria atrinae TaxID=592377 RepID=UPI0031CF2542
MRAAVIGAGIGGLSTAMGLQRKGADVTVLERSNRLRPGCLHYPSPERLEVEPPPAQCSARRTLAC